jgi:hypothetical protein
MPTCCHGMLPGGHGSAAKSVDEVGSIGAEMLWAGPWTYDLEAAPTPLLPTSGLQGTQQSIGANVQAMRVGPCVVVYAC